jgi:membrane protease YdiL (CAAX protease family)
VIQVGLAAPRRAMGLTGLVLGAAVLRALLLPLGDLASTLVFGGCLLGVVWVERRAPTLPSPNVSNARLALKRRSRGPTGPASGGGESRGLVGMTGSVVVGVLVGAVLVAPLMAGPFTARGLNGFWTWAALAALIATLEEIAIRGALFKAWSDEAGPVAAIAAGAVVFALIHLPRYGWGAMPLDAAVGLALGGLRALTGRVLPCAVAHTIADWGAWFWA